MKKYTLENECRLICQSIYKVKYNELIAKKYVDAHTQNIVTDNKCIFVNTEYLILNNDNFISVEYYLRLTGKENLLTRKVKLVAFLLESSGHIRFEKEIKSPLLLSLAMLVFCIFSSAFIFIHGYIVFQINKHDILNCSASTDGG